MNQQTKTNKEKKKKLNKGMPGNYRDIKESFYLDFDPFLVCARI